MSCTVLILGATGATGQHVVQQALDRKYHVTALVRDPAKITIQHDNLKVTKCNIFQKEDLLPHISQSDVVISTLGFSREGSLTGYVNIAKVVSECMKEVDTKRRAIFMHSWYSNSESRDRCPSFLMRKLILPYLIAPVVDGMYEAEKYLDTLDNVDYTVVLPPRLGSGPVTDKVFHTTDTEWFVPDTVNYIERADVARYMLDVMNDESSFKKVRAIAVEKEGGGCSIS